MKLSCLFEVRHAYNIEVVDVLSFSPSSATGRGKLSLLLSDGRHFDVEAIAGVPGRPVVQQDTSYHKPPFVQHSQHVGHGVWQNTITLGGEFYRTEWYMDPGGRVRFDL